MRPIYYIKEFAFQIRKFFKAALTFLIHFLSNLVFFISFCTILITIYRSGFPIDLKISNFIEGSILWLQIILWLAFLIRIILYIQHREIKRIIIVEFIILLILSVFVVEHFLIPDMFENWFGKAEHFLETLYIIIINLVVFLIEFSKKRISFLTSLKPSVLFLLSFIFLILVGALLLMLPAATTHGISITNAFFTSTSAVCVTGLTPIDTATSFTFLGKIIIIALIQIGGLGIMTFTTFFGLFFSPVSTFRNFMMAKEITNTNTFSEMSKTLMKILLFTFTLEAAGTFFIWLSLQNEHVATSFDNFKFAVFHSISAFCNAGFSTKSMNLMDPTIINNYFIQFVIAFLIILGGIGFPILLNYYKLMKHHLFNLGRLLKGKKYLYKPRIINVNSRIVVFTTLILILTGMGFFILFENNNVLQGHSWVEKIAIAFFASVTPRTAGFNAIDYSQILPITALLTIFLMWVGASPGGTGGGIKTSSLVIAIMNVFSFARGKSRIEISRREISTTSIGKAFAAILLSIAVLGIAIMLISVFNPDIDILRVAFECFSAYGTVGLSMGVTPHLCDASKWVLIVTMYLGRIGTFTLFVAFLHQVRNMKYKYPVEEININ